MKKLLLALLCVPTIHAMELVEARNVSSADESLKLYTNHKDMFVEDDNAAYRIERHAMNKDLRNVLAHKALKKFKDAGYIQINQDETGKYALAAHVRGLGGGGVGATIGVIVGKTLTYGICYGGIWVASLIAGPASTPTALVAGKVASPFIELASNKVAIGCGILGGILTGPV